MFLNLLFPPHCIQCGEAIGETGQDHGFCRECYGELPLLRQSTTCGRCGAPSPLTLAPGKPCTHCRGRKLVFDEATALGKYDGSLRELVLQTKHFEGDATTHALARLLWATARQRIQSWEVDVVGSIPMHWTRRIRRRTSGPEIAAAVIGRGLGTPVASGLLRRQRNTLPQLKLPPGQRARNVRDAFRLGAGYDLDAARVLLIDDVMTTGSTCSEAAKSLKSAGAQTVYVAVFARALVEDR